MNNKLSEAELHQYIVLAAETEGESLTCVQQAVAHLFAWLGMPAPRLPDGLSASDGPRRPRRLYPSEGQPIDWIWRQSNERLGAYAEVHLIDHTLIIRLSYGQRGEADATTWSRLGQGEWKPSGHNRFYLGQTLCFVGLVPDQTAAQAQAEQALLIPNPASLSPLRSVALPFGVQLFDRPGLPDRLALFYPGDDEAERLVNGFLNTVLPSLALYSHKIAYYYQNSYEAALRLILENRERMLADVLSHALSDLSGERYTSDPRALQSLEEYLDKLAEAYGAFAADLTEFEHVQHVVATNLTNLRQLFTIHNLPREGMLAARLADAERAMRQLEADNDFYVARVHHAEVTLAALRVRAEIWRAQIEERENELAKEENRLAERRNLILGLVGAVGAVLALGELIDNSAAQAFINWLWPLVQRTPPVPLPVGTIFWVRVFLIVSAGSVAGIVLWAIWTIGRLVHKLRERRPIR